MIVLTNYCAEQLLLCGLQAAGGGALAGPLNGSKLLPYTNNPQLRPEMDFNEFTFSTDTGLAVPKVAGFSAPYAMVGGGFGTQSVLTTWKLAAAGVGATIQGYCLLAADGVTLLAAEAAPSPKALVTVNDAVMFTAQVAIGALTDGQGTWVA